MSLILSGTDGLSDVDGSAATPAIRGTDANTGIFFPAADTIGFAEGGVEAARFDSAGNLSINSTASRTKLYVASSNANDAITLGTVCGSFFIANSNTNYGLQAGVFSTGNPWLQSMRTDGATTVYDLCLQPSGGNVGIGTSSPSDTSSYGRALDIRSSTGAAIYLRDSDGPTTDYGLVAYDSSIDSLTLGSVTASTGIMRFIAAGNEAARIDSSGNLLVGTTTTTQSHKIFGKVASAWNTQFVSSFSTAANNYGIQVQFSAATPNGGGNEFLFCEDATAVRAYIRSNGGFSNYSANNTNLSDRREKINFTPAKSYLDVICAIPVQTFNYIDQNLEEDGGLTLGVVAQDVQAVAPELVMESNWAKKDEAPKMRLSIYQTDLQYALMKCIQEQQALIIQLQADVAALKGAA